MVNDERDDSDLDRHRLAYGFRQAPAFANLSAEALAKAEGYGEAGIRGFARQSLAY